MKSLFRLFLIVAVLLGSSCSRPVNDRYDEGYDDGFSIGNTAGSSAYAKLVKKAVEFGFDFEAYASGTYISFIKLADDDNTLAVYKDQNGLLRAIRYESYDSGLSWWDNWLGTNNFFYGLTDNNDGTYSCNSGSCYEFFTLQPGSDILNMTFEEVMPEPKDLEKVGQILEDIELKRVSNKLVMDYGLSEERSYELAFLAYNWNKMSENRKMTNQDADIFALKAIGSDMKSIIDSVRSNYEGNSETYDQLIEKAGEVNGISPEHMDSIIIDLLH